MENIVESWWNEYISSTSVEMSAPMVEVLREVFYAGAIAWHYHAMMMTASETISEREAAEILSKIDDELTAWAVDVIGRFEQHERS